MPKVDVKRVAYFMVLFIFLTMNLKKDVFAEGFATLNVGDIQRWKAFIVTPHAGGEKTKTPLAISGTVAIPQGGQLLIADADSNVHVEVKGEGVEVSVLAGSPSLHLSGRVRVEVSDEVHQLQVQAEGGESTVVIGGKETPISEGHRMEIAEVNNQRNIVVVPSGSAQEAPKPSENPAPQKVFPGSEQAAPPTDPSPKGMEVAPAPGSEGTAQAAPAAKPQAEDLSAFLKKVASTEAATTSPNKTLEQPKLTGQNLNRSDTDIGTTLVDKNVKITKDSDTESTTKSKELESFIKQIDQKLEDFLSKVDQDKPKTESSKN